MSKHENVSVFPQQSARTMQNNNRIQIAFVKTKCYYNNYYIVNRRYYILYNFMLMLSTSSFDGQADNNCNRDEAA